MVATSRRARASVLAALALFACETRGAHVVAPVALSPPRYEPTKVLPCGADKLRDIMKGKLSEALGRTSYALFHDAREERMQAVVEATGLMLGCVESLKPIAQRFDPTDFGKYLTSLQQNALALQLAAIEDDEAAARHWYLHLKQSCAGCHAVFRGGVTGTR